MVKLFAGCVHGRAYYPAEREWNGGVQNEVSQSGHCIFCALMLTAVGSGHTICSSLLRPADVVFSQVINLICTEEKTAVFNVNKTQYESCGDLSVDDYQNIRIGKASAEHCTWKTSHVELCRVGEKKPFWFGYVAIKRTWCVEIRARAHSWVQLLVRDLRCL